MTISATDFRQLFPDIARHCDEPGINALLAALTTENIPAGQVVIREGDASDALYLVQQGTLSTSIQDNGKIIDLGSVTAGDSFGKESLVEPGPATRTVTADTDAVLLRLSHKAFRELEGQHLIMTGNLLRMISDELIELCRSADRIMFDRFTDIKTAAEPAAKRHSDLKEWAARIYRKLHGQEEQL
jgi:CRP-like cAMP-binding protein